MALRENIGLALTRRVRALKIDIDDLADNVGRTPKYIEARLDGIRDFEVEDLVKVCNALDMKTSELFKYLELHEEASQ